MPATPSAGVCPTLSSSLLFSPLQSVLRGLCVLLLLLNTSSTVLLTALGSWSFQDSVDFCQKIQQQLLITFVILHFNNFQYIWIFNPILNTFLNSSHIMLPFSTLLSYPFSDPFLSGTFCIAALQIHLYFLFSFPFKGSSNWICSTMNSWFSLFSPYLYSLHTLPSQDLSYSNLKSGDHEDLSFSISHKSNQLWSPVQCKVMFLVP